MGSPSAKSIARRRRARASDPAGSNDTRCVDGGGGGNSGGLVSVEGVRQDLSHEVRQRFIAEIVKLHPARAFWRRRCFRRLPDEDCKLERKMSEHVTHNALSAPPPYMGAK